MQQWTGPDVDVVFVVESLAEAEHSEQLDDLPYVILGLPIHAGLDDPRLL